MVLYFKFKAFTDDKIRYYDLKIEVVKQVENTVSKEEIDLYEQFLLFPQCFQNACLPGASKGVIVWEWVNTCFLHKMFEKKKANEVNAGYQHFLLFPQCFQKLSFSGSLKVGIVW